MHLLHLLLVALSPLGASAVSLRSQRPHAASSHKKPGAADIAAAKRIVAKRPCKKDAGKTALLQEEAKGKIYADGFSRVACDIDISPAKQRIEFKEHACGGVPSCRLLEVGMTPRLCFDFCRQQETALFFGLAHGRDCYCTRYFEPHSTGGQGVCDAKCEGDSKEMCGGMQKSSLFEMHMCGDSMSEAGMALQRKDAALAAIAGIVATANETVFGLKATAAKWQLGVCSVRPEGERICSLNQKWLALAGPIVDAAAAAQHASDRLENDGMKLVDLQSDVQNAGNDLNASLASDLELTTEAVDESSTAAMGQVAKVNITIQAAAGPFSEGAFPAFSKGFQPLGDPQNGWFALCGLEELPGQTYAAMAPDDPSPCGKKCLQVTALGCAGFNYVHTGEVASCTLLAPKGLVQPKIAKAVPIFEVSKTKRDSLGLASIGCYVNGAFMGGHPSGPLKSHVIREITLS